MRPNWSSTGAVMLVRARIVLPITQPAIENGAVLLARGRIQKVCRWTEIPAGERAGAVDLGDVLLLPGLINSHCHLDYTEMAGKIPPPRSFSDWVQALVALKGSWSNEEFAHSWKTGAAMLLRSGVTSVANIEAIPTLIPGVWKETPLRVISYREMIHLKGGSSIKQQIEEIGREWAVLPRTRAGLSPHSPYSTTADYLRLASELARRNKWLLMTHVAESEEEFEMFVGRAGRLYSWLRGQRDMSDCGVGSPVQHLARYRYLQRRLLAVHVNYIWRDDAALLGQHRVSVAHCPRSHAYFRHHPFPYEKLKEAGVNLCLGTDSLVTTAKSGPSLPQLNLFAEMKALGETHPSISPRELVSMVTINAARALGRQKELGHLAQGTSADLLTIPFLGSRANAWEAIVQHPGAVQGLMISGTWVFDPGSPPKTLSPDINSRASCK